MLSHSTKIRVRYGETDQMGYLYYGNYAQYYEVGRADLMRSIGFTYQQLEANHQIMMPVVYMENRFVRPALYDEEITVVTTLRKLPDQFITFHMELKNEAGKLVNGGRVKLCFVDARTKKRMQAPEVLTTVLSPYFKNENS